MGAAFIGCQVLLAILLFQTISGDIFDCHVGVARRHIPVDWVCDNVNDCENGLDEVNCTYEFPCEMEEMMCPDGTCISKSYKCDGEADCPLGFDEKNCDSFDISHLKSDYHTHVFPYDCKEFKCNTGGQCLVYQAVCDGIKDCPDGDDEVNCRPSLSRCPFGHAQCVGDDACIPSYWVCDGNPDCFDGSDEKGCDNDAHPMSFDHCSSDQYECAGIRGRPTCISRNKKCDGSRDCPLGDDERYYCQNASDADGSLFVGLAHEIRNTFLFNSSHREYRHIRQLNYTLISMDYNYQKKILLIGLLHNSSKSLATIDEVGWLEILRDDVVGLKDVVWDVHENNIYYTQQYPSEKPGIVVCESRLIFCRRIISGHVDPDGIKYQVYGGLAVDPSRGYLYWIEAYGTNYKIKRAKLNGSEPTTLIGEKLLLPTELALDQERNELYYSDFGISGIEKINLDTMTRHMEITKGVHYVKSLKYFNKVLYWTDRDTMSLKAANVQDKIPITRHTFNSFPQALAVNHSSYQMLPEDGPRVGCPWIRMSMPSNSSHLQSQCLCPDDYPSDGDHCMVAVNGTWPLTVAKKYLERLCQDGYLCLNGGRCSQKGNVTVCHCPNSFYGKTCERKKKSSFISLPIIMILIVLTMLGAMWVLDRFVFPEQDKVNAESPESVAVTSFIDDPPYSRLSTSSLQSFVNPNH